MRKAIALLLLLCLGLVGCATSKFVQILNQNQNLTPSELEQKSSKHPQTVNLSESVIYQVYSFPFGTKYAVYFKDNKYVGYGADDPVSHLTLQYKTGHINTAQFQTGYSMLM